MSTAASRLSAGARAVPGSGIREIAHLVAGRDDVLHLEYGEPDFAAPPHVVEAGMALARSGARYTATAGRADLREALAGKLRAVNGLRYRPEDVVVVPGAAQGLAAVFAAFVEPGDQVLVPDPGWPNFAMLATLYGAQPVGYPLRATAGFRPDPEAVRRLLTPKTRLLVLNSPSNPTGVVLPQADVAALVELAAANGTVVVADEVYDELVFTGRSVPAASYDPDWVVGAYSFSKTYAMTGWRIGYLAATGRVGQTLARIQEPLISCVSAVSQAAAMAAVTGPQECVGVMRDAYRLRRDMAVDLLRAGGLSVTEPAGAFYLMLPLPAGTDARAAALALVDRGVAVIPGTAFGTVATEALRISLAVDMDTLREAIRRILDWLAANSADGFGRERAG